MDIITLIATLIVGYLAAVICGNLLNWPDAGAVAAIAIVGSRIIWLLKKQNGSKDQ